MWRRCWMYSSQIVRGIIILLGSENEGTTILQNVGNYMCNKTASHPTRIQYSCSMQALLKTMDYEGGVIICTVVLYLVKYDIYPEYYRPVRYTYHLHDKSEKDHHTRRSLGESWLSLLHESSGPEACFQSSPLSPKYENNHNQNPSLTSEVTPVLDKPTPECTVPFEKLTVAQLAKKFHIFYDSMKVH